MIDYTNLMRIEYTILGTILYEPDHVGEVVAKLSPENFHMEATRGLFNAISALHFEGSPVDPVTTLQQAGKEYEPAIKEVLKCSTAVSNLPYYCDLLRDAVKLQQVQSEAMVIAAAENLTEAEEALDRMNGLMVARKRVTILDAAQAAMDFYSRQDTEVKPVISGASRIRRERPGAS